MALSEITVDIPTVATTLAVGSNDLGTLCTHININKWSKFKPVHQPSLNPYTNPTWWKAFDGKCGLTIPTYTSLGTPTTPTSCLHAMKNGLAVWSYSPPTGGAGSPYRLGDFRKYDHAAVMPIDSMPEYNMYLDINNSVQIDLEEVIADGHPTNLTLQDISHQGVDMREYYVGVALFKSNGNYIVATSSGKISTGNLTIVLTDMNSGVGTWEASFFMSSVPIVQGDGFTTGYYIPIDIPNVVAKISPTGTLYIVTALGQWNHTNTSISYELELMNNSGGPRTFTEIEVYLYETEIGALPATGIERGFNTHTDTTVAKNDFLVVSGSSFSQVRDQTKDYWIGAKALGAAMNYNQIEDFTEAP